MILKDGVKALKSKATINFIIMQPVNLIDTNICIVR